MRQLARLVVWLLVAIAGLSERSDAADQKQKPFSKLVGPVKVGDVVKAEAYPLPFLTWGGDVATFHANGGLTTKKDSPFDKLGLKFKLTPGDDFVAQVRDYLSGKTPYLRGTMSQLGQASEVLNGDARCKPVVFLQLTWSQGDHMVSRPNIKTLNDLKGKKIALQAGGPHVGMMDDVLKTAGVKWDEVTVVWTKGVTGKDGPAELFRKDKSVDACFVISPDMQGLTGGLDKSGSGADGTVKDTRVLISTATMKRSIADVYACRKDFFDKNKATVEKLAAGYLKGCEDLLEVKAHYKKDKKATVRYRAILRMARRIYGKDVLANDVEADGLISDAAFVGLPGNRAFFKEQGNPSSFAARMDSALKLAVSEGYAGKRADFLPPDFSYTELKRVGALKADVNQGRLRLTGKEGIAEPIFTFQITFDLNQSDFSVKKYGADFKRAVELASLFGNAVITVRGHTDPSKVLREFVKVGLARKTLRRVGPRGSTKYRLEGGPSIDLNDARSLKVIAAQIAKDDYETAPVLDRDTNARLDPKAALKGCQQLSGERAGMVYLAVLKYAGEKKLVLDKNQIKPIGVGIFEPVVPRPRNDRDAARNRRVEFRIYKLKYNAESAGKNAFDY